MTNIIRWSGHTDLDRFRAEVDRLFDDFFSSSPYHRYLNRGDWVPAVDVADTGKEIIVHVELPGMDAKDIDTSVKGRVLTIKGEKKRDEELERKSYHRLERRYGSFIRSFELPADIDTDKMRASYENGVLSLHLSKAKVRPVKRIEVERR